MLMRPNGVYRTEILPYQLKKEIVINYMFIDIVNPNRRFFSPSKDLKNDDFIYSCCIGLIPRHYEAHDLEERVIFVED